MKNGEENINIFVLTHKKFDYPKNEVNDVYMPLLCNSANINEDLDYLKDNTGDNISNLNEYYAELTGQYWAWKNTDADIIGFCHYRRYFANNILLTSILTEEEIRNDLKDHDIIVSQLTHEKTNLIDRFFDYNKDKPWGAKLKEFNKLRKIIKEDYPDYLDTFDKITESNTGYFNNMFITRKKIADDYFQWLFSILDKLEKEIDFSEYVYGNSRVLGYISEVLLKVYIDKNNLKVKERYLLSSGDIFPHLTVVCRRFPIIADILSPITSIVKDSQ